ncbi:AI-2E family transporter [Methanovulcanius yangii]|uniref:AI-2E family transporter n=1 Tax=Methanovulcanius yangii TaxID=1789227 RepID=UPI0029CA2C7D|nr:AI-2E family transporter [Methanovulcanius yangii]
MRVLPEGHDRLLIAVIAVLVLVVGIVFFPLINVLVIAAAFATVLVPYHRVLSRHIAPGLSSFVITAAVIIALAAVLAVSFGTIAANIGYIQYLFDTIFDWMLGDSELAQQLFAAIDIPGMIDEIIANISSNIAAILGRSAYFAIMAMILFLFQYLLTVYGEEVYGQVWSRIPLRSRAGLGTIRDTVVDTLYSLFIVHVAIAVIVFVAAIPFFTLLGYGHVMFWAVSCAIFALIPVFGPVIIIAFLAVYTIAIGDVRGLALVVVLGWPLLCAIPDWYLRPVLMGKRSKMNAVLTFIAFFGGIAILGILGFLYGPLALAVIVASYRVLLGEYPPAAGGEETAGAPGGGPAPPL